MIERASADVRLVPGDLIGSGTVGGGCLLEIKDESGFGRWLAARRSGDAQGRAPGRADVTVMAARRA